jgi:pimeloyl-ACP methyl ester carboxylesterase
LSSSGGFYGYVGDDPAAVESALAELGHVGDTFAVLAGEVEHDTASIRQFWPKGRTGELAAADAARIGGALDECHQVFARAQRGLSELYPVLVAGRRRVDDLNHAYLVLAGPVNTYNGTLAADFPGLAAPQQLFEAQDTLRAVRARAGYESVADIDRAYARVRAQVSEEAILCEGLLNQLAAQGSPVPGQAVGQSKFDVSFGLLRAGEVAGILDGSIGFPSDTMGVHDAWLLLSPDQRTELLRARPLWFGNLNGIPVADRNTANQATLTAQLDRLAVGLEAAGLAPTADPTGLDGLDLAQIRRLEARCGLTLREAKQALLLQYQLTAYGKSETQLTAYGKSETQLLAYEPGAFGGKGRAAIAFGNLDHAANIAFCVPGFQSSLDNIKNVASDAQNLYDQAYLVDPGHTAVVAWQGYDAPGGADVLTQGAAQGGGRRLAADVNAVRVTHAGPVGTLTVIGHSYGSTTTALALQRDHMQVDQVALIGSPGVGGDAQTVAGLHLKSSQVFVGAASRDIVTMAHSLSDDILGTDALGANPALDTFGATAFKAESVDRGFDLALSDHSRYYDATGQSESLYALVDIATGHGDRLGADGMLAQPRHEVGIDKSKLPIFLRRALREIPMDLVVAPEGSRTPTAGHDHANDPRRPSP